MCIGDNNMPEALTLRRPNSDSKPGTPAAPDLQSRARSGLSSSLTPHLERSSESEHPSCKPLYGHNQEPRSCFGLAVVAGQSRLVAFIQGEADNTRHWGSRKAVTHGYEGFLHPGVAGWSSWHKDILAFHIWVLKHSNCARPPFLHILR